MIRGVINDSLELKVAVEVSNENGASHTVEALVDTGFGGDLTLPPDAVERLGLECIDQIPLNLAGGQQLDTTIHRGFVKWFERARMIHVIAAEGQPLLGMTLLDGCKITVRVRPGGEALIEEDGEA